MKMIRWESSNIHLIIKKIKLFSQSILKKPINSLSSKLGPGNIGSSKKSNTKEAKQSAYGKQN